MTDVKTFARDLAERAGWTFLQSFVGVFAAASSFTSIGDVKVAAMAGLGAGVASVASLVKGVSAGTVTGTASSLKTAEAKPADAPAAPAA